MADYDPNEKLWRIVVQSKNGMCHVPDLTLADAKHVYERLDPNYGVYEESLFIDDDHVNYRDQVRFESIKRTVIGPREWDSDEVHKWPFWPMEQDIYFDKAGKFLREEFGENYPEELKALHSAVGKTYDEVA